MLSKKAQAALEYLMTYGWTILIVLVGIAALAYFGVLRPDAFISDKCILPVGITCLDHKVENYRVTLVLQNSLGETITLNKVSVSERNQECSGNLSTILNSDEKIFLTISECNNGASGGRFDGTVNVTYTLEDKLTHTISGTLKAKVVEGSSVSVQNICQNAQSNGLCDGLDIVYGFGYRTTCCSEHNLCC